MNAAKNLIIYSFLFFFIFNLLLGAVLRLYIQSLQKDTSVMSPDASWARCSFQPTGWRKMRNDRVFSSQLFLCIIGTLKTGMHVRKLSGRCLGWARCCSSLALFLLDLGCSPASSWRPPCSSWQQKQAWWVWYGPNSRPCVLSGSQLRESRPRLPNRYPRTAPTTWSAYLVTLPPASSTSSPPCTSLLVSVCFMKGRTEQFALGITEMWHSKPLTKWKQRGGCILLLSTKMKSGACAFGPPVPFPSPCTPASTDAPHVDQGCVA